MAFQLANRRSYPWKVGLAFAVVVVFYWFGPLGIDHASLSAALTSVGAVGAFLYAQHLQETLLFRDLFANFNHRYDELNEALNAIEAGHDLRPDEVNTLTDYFNLCAEEYLFFKAGYIDESVWRSWSRGMAVFSNKPNVQALWIKELESGSYYGFTLDKLKSL